MLRNDGLSRLCYLQAVRWQQLNQRSTSCFQNAEIQAGWRSRLQDPEKAETQDPVDTWIRLTTEWDAAYARFVLARDSRLMGESLIDGHRDDLRAAEEKALEDLHSLKARMNELITRVGRNREVVKETIVLGTLQTRSGEPPEKREPPGIEEKTAKHNKF